MNMKLPKSIKSTALAAAATSLFAVSVYGDDWVGTNSSNWNDPLNWSATNVPSGVGAAVNTGTNNVPVISSNAPLVSEIVVGGYGGTGRIDHIAGTIGTTNVGWPPGWVLIGYGSDGTGIYNLADTTATGGTLTGYGTGSGTLQIADVLNIGEPFNVQTNTRGTLNVNTTGMLAVSGNLNVGVNGSTAIANLDAGTVTANDLNVGQGGSTAAFNQSGGTVTETWRAFVARDAGSTGVYTMTGGTNTSANNGQFHIGDSAASTGTLNMGGGVISNFIEMLVGVSGTGAINQSAGTLAASAVRMGTASGGAGSYTMTGGSLTIGEIFGDSLMVGVSSNATGAFTQSGGAAVTAGNIFVGRNGGSGTYTQSSGSMEFGGWGLALAQGSTNSVGVVNLDGGSVTATSGVGWEANVVLASGSDQGGGGTATFNLNGGTLTTRKIYTENWTDGVTTNFAGTSVLNFNGGTLKATQTKDVGWDPFVGGLTHAYVKSGGAVIDSAGYYVLITQLLEGDTNSTGGGLTKNGAGTLEMSAQNNTFTGEVTVNAGTLKATPGNSPTGGAFTSASGVTVNSNATLIATANALFGSDGSLAKTITVNAGGTAVAVGSDQNVGLVVLNGGTLASSDTDGSGWGTWNFARATEKKLLVTDNSTVSALGVGFRNGATIEVTNGKNLDFTGTILNSFDGTSTVIKTGAGTLTLSGSNSYTGVTTVSAGSLLVNGNNSTATGAVTVDSGATLGGSGTIGGATTINGTHSPGNSPAVQTFASDLGYGSAAAFSFELISNASTGRGTTFDGVNVGGSLSIASGAVFNVTLNGAGSTTDFGNVFWSTNQSWLVFDPTGVGTTTGNFAIGTVSLDSLGKAYSSYGSFSTSADVNNDLYLNWTAVPEPSTYALLILSGAGFAGHVIRRRSRRND